MSVQNNLKKPAFTKTVMGYTVSEVDKYIEHITERYNSVCAENSELKRRVLRLQLKLDEINDKLGDAETAAVDPRPLDRSVLYEVFDVLDAELRRTEAFYEDLKGKLNAISEVKNTDVDDSDWESTLSAFIASVNTEVPEVSESDTEVSGPDEDGIFADFESFVLSDEDGTEDENEDETVSEEVTDVSLPADDFSADETIAADEEADGEKIVVKTDLPDSSEKSDASYEEETEMLLKLLQGTFNVSAEEEKPFEHDLGAEFTGGDRDAEEEYDEFLGWNGGVHSESDTDEADLEAVSDETPEESAQETAPEAEAREKTPAELAAELDFYTDSVHRDGESFDPMTLARQATERKPKYEDFFRSDPPKNKK